MDDSTALAWFGGKDKLNCAQAILKAFQPAFGTSDAEIEAFKTAGLGKAPDGVCGALYAAKHLLGNPELAGKLDTAFERQAGAVQCKKIRKLKKLVCRDCVALAARLLQDHRPPSG